MDYNEGDRVIITNNSYGENLPLNSEGTVIYLAYKNNYGIEFDKHLNAGNLMGKCKAGHGYIVPIKSFEILETLKFKVVKK